MELSANILNSLKTICSEDYEINPMSDQDYSELIKLAFDSFVLNSSPRTEMFSLKLDQIRLGMYFRLG